ncbi:hypothetical protein [Candidatus Symbiobacter mobilis]|uniref:Zeta toxin domain-containing protein n=1 Tax=Candidatus Symbiobacter mobilis CR TaxID=946483 RepID=U5NB12_9BURK|nr:hypothetical protein [Candidatus Symbiobacter mobilis]AGX87418.1 hypothetical protein Cenrod_1328 [Candidatus Symbiobacter mobilis CR]
MEPPRKTYLHHIPQWQAAGYWVELIFLRLANADEAVARVALRVKQGGHNIPEMVIRRRFDAGLHHFTHHYSRLVNAWALYDNSGELPQLLDWSER